MSRKGISCAMRTQILEMHAKQVSIRKICKALGLSRNTVRNALREEGVGEASIKVAAPDATRSRPWLLRLNVEEIIEKKRRGRPYNILYEEYGPPVSYSAFRRAIKELVPASEKAVTMRLEHVAGEKTFVDYADGIAIYDSRTGEKTTITHLFCGVLPFSSLTFGEFVFNQKLESFIASHENMWAYFGGVTPYVVVDNLKSGVTKAHLYDPDINPTYCDYANKRGFAVLPARPYHPKDKASVEAAIGVIQRGFYQIVAERKFYSIGELNHAFREYLDKLNLATMKDYGVSRRQRFEEEKPLLKPVPCEAYEISQWKEAVLHPDCHVQIQNHFYSAPHLHIGRRLRIRLRQKFVEIYTPDGACIAVHDRIVNGRRGEKRTVDDHYPEYKKQIGSFDIRLNIKKAEEIGGKTAELVKLLFAIERPLKNLRVVQGLLRLHTLGEFERPALEYAASQAITFQRYRLAFIKSCAQHFQANPKRIVIVAPERDLESIHLHQPFL